MPPDASLHFQNWYVTRLREAVDAVSTTIYVDNPPAIGSGILVLEGKNASKREIIYFSSVSGYALNDCVRGLEGTTPNTHNQGATIEQAVTAGQLDQVLSPHILLQGLGNDENAAMSQDAVTRVITKAHNTDGTLKANSVGGQAIANGAVTSGKIANNAVTTAAIANGAVDPSKLSLKTALITWNVGAGTGTKTIPTPFRAKRLEVIDNVINNDNNGYTSSGRAILNENGTITQRATGASPGRSRYDASKTFIAVSASATEFVGAVTAFNASSISVNVTANNNSDLRTFYIQVYDY